MATISIAEGAQKILAKYGGLIETYRGGIPAQIVAARIWHETGGVACPTPTPCCDEQGLMQLWPKTRQKYGVTNACDPAQNIRAGCLHWNAEIASMQQAVPVFESGPGFWKLAYLYTAIGSHATATLVKASAATTYAALAAWVADNFASGALERLRSNFGSQSSDIIARRVKAADTYVSAAFGAGGGGLVGLLFFGAAAFGVYWWLRHRGG